MAIRDDDPRLFDPQSPLGRALLQFVTEVGGLRTAVQSMQQSTDRAGPGGGDGRAAAAAGAVLLDATKPGRQLAQVLEKVLGEQMADRLAQKLAEKAALRPGATAGAGRPGLIDPTAKPGPQLDADGDRVDAGKKKPPAGPGPVARGADATAKLIGGIIAEPFKRITAALGPMAIMAQAVNSNLSGFQVFLGAIRVLAATLAPLLLPVFALVAAAVIAVSDELWDNLQPGLEKAYQTIFNDFIPVVEQIVGVFRDAFGVLREKIIPVVEQMYDVIKRVVGWVWDQLPKVSDENGNVSGGLGGAIAGGIVGMGVGGPLGGLIGAGVGYFAGRDDEDTGGGTFWDGFAERFGGGRGAGVFDGGGAGGGFGPGWDSAPDSGSGSSPGGGSGLSAAIAAGVAASQAAGKVANDPRSRVGAAMRDVAAELRLSMGPKASFSGLADVSRQAQLAASNASPFETRILERMTAAIGALERVANNTARQPDVTYRG